MKQVKSTTMKRLKEVVHERGFSLHEIEQKLGRESIRQLLKELYWNKCLSTYQMAEKLQTSKSAILRRMVKLEIPRRKPGGRLRYPKYPFSGNNFEKSYLLGLRAGDLRVRKHRKQIEISVGTTHPAMIKLFYDIFRKYSRISQFPQYNRGTKKYYWYIYGFFDQSFKFLLKKPKIISSEIFTDEKRFLAFLAGYTDAEGSLVISYYKEEYGEYTMFIYEMKSQDFEILNGIKEKLTQMGYHPSLRSVAKKGLYMEVPT